MKMKNEMGNRYGRLTVIARTQNNARRNAQWLCRCECGNDTVVIGNELRSGHTRSCGCLHREQCETFPILAQASPLRLARVIEARTSHGLFANGGRQPRLYMLWSSILQRTGNPRSKSFKYYGARGIAVHSPWRDFVKFANDLVAEIGEPPEGMSLDRIDNDGGYVPGNLRWATPLMQRRNTRPYGTALRGGLL